MKLFDLISFFQPQDHMVHEHVAVWRHKVAYTLAVIVLTLLATPFAAEFRYVSTAQAEEAHREMQVKLDSFGQELELLNKRAKQEAIRDLRVQIWDMTSRFCRAEGELRIILSAQLNDLLTDYREEADEEFPSISCENLIGLDAMPGRP